MIGRKKAELIPGGSNLKATPSASRKNFKIEGLSEKQNSDALAHDLKTKPRWRVTRQKLSGGTAEGFVVFGDALLSFIKLEDDAVSFSQPYHCVVQYGLVEGSATDVFWVFAAPSMLLQKESVRYVFTPREHPNLPAGTTLTNFWLEELDRAVLESERRRFKVSKLANSSKLPILPSSKAAETLVPQTKQSTISSMFAPVQSDSLRLPPTVVLEDRFPCAWVEWKNDFGLQMLKSEDDSVLVILVPMRAGVLVMNPSSDGNAEFLGELICIPWSCIKSHGASKVQSISFVGVTRDSVGEKTFIFRTSKCDTINDLFLKYIKMRSDDLFPTRWPPLRYDAQDRPELNKHGVNIGGK